MKSLTLRAWLLLLCEFGVSGECRCATPPIATANAQSQGVVLKISIPQKLRRGDSLPLTLSIQNTGSPAIQVDVVAAFPLGKAVLTNRDDGKAVALTPNGEVALDDEAKRYRGQMGLWKLTKDKTLDATLDLQNKYQWKPGRYKMRFRLTFAVIHSDRTITLNTDNLEFELTE